MKRSRNEQTLEQEIEGIKEEIKSLKAEKLEWKGKAEEAEKNGNKDEAKEHMKRYDTVNAQLASLQERLNRKEEEEGREQKREKVDEGEYATLPARIPKPSEATEGSFSHTMKFGSAAIHETVFQCLKWCVGEEPIDERFLKAAGDILKLFDRFSTNEKFGFFMRGEADAGEVAYTSLLTDLLHHHFPKTGEFFLHWVHQLPDPTTGRMDIALYVSARIDSPIVPVAIVEVGFKGGKSKRWQAAAYATNVFGQVRGENHSLLSLELMIAREGKLPHKMALRGYAKARSAEVSHDEKGLLWASTILDCDVDEASLGNVLKSLVGVAGKALEDSPTEFLRIGTNVCIDRANDTVVKFFDYRFREVVPEQRRSTKLSLEHLGAKKVIESDNLEVISYPFLKGKHYATKVGQFVDVANEMKELHAKKVCHGDIRAFNILFREGEKSRLIDFDFAGESGKKSIPRVIPMTFRMLRDTKMLLVVRGLLRITTTSRWHQ